MPASLFPASGLPSLPASRADNLRTLIGRGRLVETDALIGRTVFQGVTFISMVSYFGWRPRTIDQILIAHGVDPNSGGFHYLTTRDETGPGKD